MDITNSLREVDIREQINKLSDISTIERIYIFGSRLFKTGSTRSDIDLLLYSPSEELLEDDLLPFYDDEPALDLFKTRDLMDARSVINGSHIFDKDLLVMLKATLLWTRESGFVDDAIKRLGAIRVRVGVRFDYSVLPGPVDPHKADFHEKYGGRNAFMIMPFGKQTNPIYSIIKEFFDKKGVKIVRADEHNFTGAVWTNVKLHMDCCDYGIALFNKSMNKQKKSEIFNPNVSLEVGYMLAQGKPICILKDKKYSYIFSDLASKYYYEYKSDKKSVKGSIEEKLSEWFDNENIPL